MTNIERLEKVRNAYYKEWQKEVKALERLQKERDKAPGLAEELIIEEQITEAANKEYYAWKRYNVMQHAMEDMVGIEQQG